MTCDESQRCLLDRDWDRAALDEAAAISEHVARCPACRQAVDEYDQLRALLRMPAPMPKFPTGAQEGSCTATRRTARPRRFARWGWPAALALSLLIAVTGWAMYLHTAGAPGDLAGPPSFFAGATTDLAPSPGSRAAVARQAVQWTTADVEREVGVFTNVSETFEGRTSWVAMGERAAELGLMPAPSQHRKVLLLRLLVSEGDQPRSQTDLVIVPSQNASLDVPFGDGLVLRYHIATTADHHCRLSIWAEVRTPNGDGETLAALATQLSPVPGQLLSAGRLVTSSSGYNLEISFQEKDLSRN
ncbi:MAG: hypothetical protein NTW96_05515 [Planctomycetia bacterium]|nr:hypothetical protein [Planctomycetia bacterium]